MTDRGDAIFAGKPVLITGGAGFIGSNLAHRLLEAGACLTLVDSFIPQYGGNPFNLAPLDDRVRVNISDVRDEYSMRRLVEGQVYLFNLAGQTSHLDSMQDPYTDLDINAKAQLSILEACRKHNAEMKIVFASTRQIYGRPRYLPVDEQHPLRPVDINGINKLAGEQYHLLYHDTYGLRTSALRLTNTYGPRMRIKDARQTFLGVWIRQLLQDEAVEVWGGDQLRDFTYVDDAVDALLRVARSNEADGRVFNLGGGEAVSLRSLAELLVEVNGGGRIEVHSFPEERKRIDIGDYYADDRLIRDLLGWRPQITLREGLLRTLTYYRRHLTHYL